MIITLRTRVNPNFSETSVTIFDKPPADGEFAGARNCWKSATDATAKSTHLSDADIVLSMFIVYRHVIPSKCAAIYLVYSAVNTVFWNFNGSSVLASDTLQRYCNVISENCNVFFNLK